MVTKDSDQLQRYATHIHQRCPGVSTAKDILSFLNVLNSKTNAELLKPCSASDTSVCHIVDHLDVCNKFLRSVHVELKEVEPGEFGFFPWDEIRLCGSDLDPRMSGWTLLHWLLQEHSCIKTVVLPWLMGPKYEGIWSDALRLNSGLNKLTLKDWHAKGGFANVISAIATLAHLEELDMEFVSLLPSTLGDFGHALEQISMLKTLTLPRLETNVDMVDPSIDRHICVAQLVRALKGCSKLAVLSSIDYVLEPECVDVFAELVAESGSLRRLSLHHVFCYNDSMHALFAAVGQNQNIEELELDGFELYEEQDQLLAKAAAQHAGLRRLAVGLYDSSTEWELDGHALADLVGRNTSLRELEFVGGSAGSIPEFAEAVRKNTSLQKLTLGLADMDVSDYREFLQALACNQSIQLVTFKEYSYYSRFNDIILLMQETGTEGRLEIDAHVDDPQDFESGLKNSTSLTKVVYSPRKADRLTLPGTFHHLLRHRQLQELSISMEHHIELESATSLALLFSTTNSLRSVTLEFLSTAASSQILVEGLASNTSLTSLSISYWTFEAPGVDLLWHTLGSSKTLKSVTLDLLDLGQGQALDQVPHSLLNNHYLLKATIQQQGSQVYYSGIRQDVMKKLPAVSTPTFQFGVQELLRRNLSTLHRATQFAMGFRGRRFAEAFERVSKGFTIVDALKKALGESEDEAKRRIARCAQYLDEHFLAEAGVVRGTVACDKSSDVQLDQIGLDNWLRIRQYLKVTDIILKPGVLPSGPSSSKKHC